MRQLSEEKYSEEKMGLWGKIIHKVAIFSAPSTKMPVQGFGGLRFFFYIIMKSTT
jgi:hypothetical protein